MDATRRLDIELPEDLAEAVSARVASGRFADASEVIQEGLRLLAEEEEFESDPAVEEWLRTVAVARYDEWKANPSGGMTLEEVQAGLKAARKRRQAGA